jgi:integrase
MATITQRGNRWQAMIRRKGYPQISKAFEYQSDAVKWGKAQERLLDMGEWVPPVKPAKKTTKAGKGHTNGHTLADLLDRYEAEVSIHKRGADVERYRLRGLKKTPMASLGVTQITSAMVAEWRDQRLTEVEPGSVCREMVLLRHVFSVAVREWSLNIAINPAANVRKPKEPEGRDRILTPSEREALLRECGKCVNPWVKPVVIFALETAARRGEILSLEWKNVDLDKATAKITGKTGARTIPLSKASLQLLWSLAEQSFPDAPADKHVFPITAEAFKQAFEKAVKRAKIEGFVFHDCRHDALTRLAKLGLNVLELRAISGHTTATMLQRYVKIDPSELAMRL